MTDDLDSRLTNWGICQRVYKSPNYCESIEHRYVFHREKLTEGEMETRRAPKLIVDHKDAAVVESCWRQMPTRKLQQVLKLSYVNKAPPPFICRHLNIQQSRDDRYFLDALCKAQQEIDTFLSKTLDNGPNLVYFPSGFDNLQPST